MAFSLKDKRAVLFDMDGVLYDSMPLHVRAWSRAMADFGYHMTVDEIYANEGCTGAYTIRTVSLREGKGDVSDEDVNRIYARKSEYFHSMPEPPMMPGAYSLMCKANACGMKILVVTGSGQQALIERVQRDYNGFVFRDLMVTAFDVKRGKPFPDPYLKGLELAGVQASEAFVVENAPLGLRSARAAGIETIAVNTGPLADEKLLAEGPAVLFSSMQAFDDGWDSLF